MDDSVTVVTITRGRPILLLRAMASVQQQDYSGPIAHLIIVDACPNTKVLLESLTEVPDNLIWHWFPRNGDEHSGPARLGKLRNHAVQMASTQWLSFLDDDNEFEPNHISSLVTCARRSGCRVVHSHMQIFRQDGSPYLEPRLPWWRDPKEGERLYIELCSKGVFQPGSNIVRDRADPWDHPDPVRTVDTGEWLFDRKLLHAIPFSTLYSAEDWARVTTEDDKLMESLIENRVPIACSALPTLKYNLGGYSNSFDWLESGVASTSGQTARWEPA